MVKAVRDAIVRIDEGTNISIKFAIGIACMLVTATGMYWDTCKTQEAILERISAIEANTRSENTWTRGNMNHFVREAKLMNPTINLPDPETFVEKSN